MARRWNAWAVSAYDKDYCEMTSRRASSLAGYLLTLSRNELQRIAFDDDEPAYVSGTAFSILKASRQLRYDVLESVLSRAVGRPTERVEISSGVTTPHAKTFEEFCQRANYPMPFVRQVEMMRFGHEETGARLLLGARGYGKTDYVTILGTAWQLLQRPSETSLIVTKSEKRNVAIVAEIRKAAAANGVEFEKSNTTELRVAGLHGKDSSVLTLPLGSTSFRGQHPTRIILDDPVTEEDVSEATRRRVQRVYNELMKLTPNILVIGQPVHKFDLFETLRPLLRKLELPHGSIPELDADLIAQRAAGVSEASIQASYFLKIISETGFPFEKISYIDKFPVGSSVCFIDPAFEGEDYTALSIVRQHFDNVAVYGRCWRLPWYECVDQFQTVIDHCRVQRVCFETNAVGEQPVLLLRDMLEGVGVVGKRSTGSKHARIMAVGPFAKQILLARDSDQIYLDQVRKYEYGAAHDDAPDSLAGALEWIGLIRGRA